MKETKELTTNKGITLIALVITIIVMLILVGVTISMAVNGGLFDYAGKAVSETNNALKAEQQLADGGIEVDGKWYNSIDEYLNKDKVETISKTESYIGYYADVDGDKVADGVIYADLAFSKENESWSYGYSYEAETATELKDYYVSGTHNGDFGNGVEVLTATGEGKDRFYVMALEDFTEEGNTYCWYYNAYDNENTQVVTSDGFGTGKANTTTMIEKWNASAFGTQNGHSTRKDMWGSIQTLASKGWFVPSAGEWDAFADAFNVSSEFDDDGNWAYPYGLSNYNWTSTQAISGGTWDIIFEGNLINCDSPYNLACVRLSATF